jgi:hypothetical protein
MPSLEAVVVPDLRLLSRRDRSGSGVDPMPTRSTPIQDE